MSLFQVVTSSGRIVDGTIPFNADALKESIEKIIIDHPQLKITLEGHAHYFIYNEAFVLMGAGVKRYAVNIGTINDDKATGYVITQSFCNPKVFDLSTFHEQTRKKMFKNGVVNINSSIQNSEKSTEKLSNV